MNIKKDQLNAPRSESRSVPLDSHNERSHVEDRDAESVKLAEKTLLAKLGKTQRAIRRVDLFTAFCACATLALAILFLGALCDSWLLSSGLSIRGRLFFVVFLLVASLARLVWKLVPVLRRRVNSLYAAKVLEETQHDRHNLTINWLQLCRDGSLNAVTSETSPLSEQALETRRAVLDNVVLQAARQSRRAPEETTVDCTSLIRWGIALTALVLICAVYVVLSPKNLFVSVARIVAPTSKIERPQALRFESVEPGDVDVFQGDFIDVVATIPGAKISENVEILWSTEDGRITDVSIPMESSGPNRFQANFPAEKDGFSENLSYMIVAGRGSQFESASNVYRVSVRPQPSFRVEKTTLQFPEYTGLSPQTFESQGDLRALENTTVEITARANERLARAFFLPDGDQTRAVRMTIDPNEPDLATISFPLRWQDPDAQELRPEFSTYSLQSEDVNGEKNRDAQVYTVSILEDLPPTIVWDAENTGVVQAPLNDVLPVKFTAEDPDYSLRRVLLRVAYANLNQGDLSDQKPDPEPIELPFPGLKTSSDPTKPTPFIGPQSLSYQLTPEELGLEVGDELEYWGVAFDSKTPDANVGMTEKRIFVVVEPVENPRGSNDEPEENPDEGAGASSDDAPSQGENASDSQQNNGDQGQNNSDQPEDSNQTGDNSDSSAPDGVGESGDESGESSPNLGDAQGQEEASAGGESEEDSQNSNGGDENGESGDDSGQQGDNSDESSSQSSSSGGENSEQQGDTASENEEESGEVSESPTDPNAAFQKILDYMNAQQKDSGDDESGSGDDEKGTEGQEGADGERAPTDRHDDVQDNREEVDPNFHSDSDLGAPEEKRELPTRTSPDKPDENLPSYQADNPEDVDSSSRRHGDVDPDTSNFLAQNADPDAQEGPRSNEKRNEDNIMLDPLDQSQQTAADSIDPNASEAQGGKNPPPEGGASEVDPDAPNDPNRTRSPAAGQDLNDQQPTAGGGAGGSDGPSGSDNSDEGEGSGGNSSDKQSDENNVAPSSGDSDEDGVAHGGGSSGSGRGEIEASEERLSPADAPRLQYAEEATNLVLEYLEDNMKDKIDERLLNELGWTEAETRAFLAKWQRMRDDARGDDETARERYLDALKKVGLDEYAPLDSGAAIDELRERNPNDPPIRSGAREATRIKTPDRLSDRVRAFNRGVSMGTGSNLK